MALSLQIRQAQRQAITPAMMTELSLLQLPIGELREAVKKEVESNPALEIELPRGRGVSRAPSSDGSKEGFLENVADERGETLDEHLLSELRMSGVEGRDLALAKAVVESLDGDTRACKVTVPDNQLSLAIGNKGQNARLCARLTGYNIDICPESGYYGEERPAKEAQE